MAARKKKAAPKKKQKKAAPKQKAPPKKKKKAAAPKKKAAPAERATLKKLPLLWRVDTSAQAAGLWVDQQVWAGNENGEVFCISKDGVVERTLTLPGMVDSLIADEAWKYAGCADGNVYDLTGRVPRAMYQTGREVQIDWMEMYRGNLCVSDDAGGLFVVDVEGNEQWQKRDQKANEGWMVRTNASGLFHGSMAGLRHYDWDGGLLWQIKNIDDVRCGWWATPSLLVVITGFNKVGTTTVRTVTSDGKVKMSALVDAESGSLYQDGAESCGAGRTAGGELRLYVSTGEFLFCFAEDGACIWEVKMGMGSACTMQIEGERLFMVTGEGSVACVDISEAAIDSAVRGKVPKVKVTKLKRLKVASAEVERTTDSSKGVVVECVKEGSKVRVKVISGGYNADWYVQFPRDLREVGARFVVDEVREATQGGFYRALGDIKRLDS